MVIPTFTVTIQLSNSPHSVISEPCFKLVWFNIFKPDTFSVNDNSYLLLFLHYSLEQKQSLWSVLFGYLPDIHIHITSFNHASLTLTLSIGLEVVRKDDHFGQSLTWTDYFSLRQIIPLCLWKHVWLDELKQVKAVPVSCTVNIPGRTGE